MKTKKIIYSVIFLFSVSLFIFTSCKTEDIEIADETILSTTNDDVQIAKISDEITTETDIYISGLENEGYAGFSGVQSIDNTTQVKTPTVTVDKPDSTHFPKIITIDFGTTGFINHRGDTIKGKIEITITNKMYVPNSSRTIVFTNFSVNNNAVSGTKTVTYKGLNDLNNPYWTISADLSFTLANGKNTTWKSERTRERISNNNTPKIMWDDNYSIKGTTAGVNVKGNTYSIEINNNNPFILLGGFPYFVKGDATITVGEKNAVIDFGDGTKDNKATVTINGVTKEITLKK